MYLLKLNDIQVIKQKGTKFAIFYFGLYREGTKRKMTKVTVRVKSDKTKKEIKKVLSNKGMTIEKNTLLAEIENQLCYATAKEIFS